MPDTQTSGAMTSRERILAAMRREPVDRVPCAGFFNPLSPLQREGHEWQFPWAPDSSGEEQLRYQLDVLGLDQIIRAGAGLCRPVDGVESKVWKEGEILHKTHTTPGGELHAAVRLDRLWPHGEDLPFCSDFNIGHFVEPWIQSEADLECYKQVHRLCETEEVIEQARAGMAAAKARAEQDQLATAVGIGTGLTGALQIFGAEDLCLTVVDQPELVDAYLEHDHQINLRTIEVLGDVGVDIIWRNGFYETADYYSPAMLERFLGPRLRAEADAVHAIGALSSYTIHTGIAPILDYLAGLTIDSFFGIDIEFRGLDLEETRDKLAPTKSFWIGPSSTFHLWKGPERTREAVRRVFEVFGKNGLILSQCVSSHSIMPWESTLAMIDEWKKLRRDEG